MLAMLHHIAKPLFSDVHKQVRQLMSTQCTAISSIAATAVDTSASVSAVDGPSDDVCQNSDGCESTLLLVASPMLRIVQSEGDASKSVVYAPDSVVSAANRCKDRVHLYETTVLPRLEELLSIKRQHQASSYLPQPFLPLPPPPPHPPSVLNPNNNTDSGFVLHRHHNYHEKSTLKDFTSMAPPCAPPAWFHPNMSPSSHPPSYPPSHPPSRLTAVTTVLPAKVSSPS